MGVYQAGQGLWNVPQRVCSPWAHMQSPERVNMQCLERSTWSPVSGESPVPIRAKHHSSTAPSLFSWDSGTWSEEFAPCPLPRGKEAVLDVSDSAPGGRKLSGKLLCEPASWKGKPWVTQALES